MSISGDHTFPSPVGIRALSLMVKWPEHEADHFTLKIEVG
jgi:hypothetical protein